MHTEDMANNATQAVVEMGKNVLATLVYFSNDYPNRMSNKTIGNNSTNLNNTTSLVEGGFGVFGAVIVLLAAYAAYINRAHIFRKLNACCSYLFKKNTATDTINTIPEVVASSSADERSERSALLPGANSITP